VERDISQPGLVYKIVGKATRSFKPKPLNTAKTRQIGPKSIASPSIAHMRVAGRQELDPRSKVGRDVVATGPDFTIVQAHEITVILPQITTVIKNVAFPERVTKDYVTNLIVRQLNITAISSDYLEFAPADWSVQKFVTVRFTVNRPDLAGIEIIYPEQFTREFDPSIPVFIETDGSCSRNPGPGGWGAIICQKGKAIEAFGSNAHTSNNEMELQAIAESLDFIPNTSCYIVIESDSEGCLHMMMGAGEIWMANNYLHLKGNLVKNKELVDRICVRLRTLHAQFRKVGGHKGDQWNDRADALAVMGRNEAIGWPKCSFKVIKADGRVPFRTRPVFH
jgi:ribonuclease HI